MSRRGDGPCPPPGGAPPLRLQALAARLMAPWARFWFRLRVAGVEHVPSGPCLLVANHNGTGVVETRLLACLQRRGVLRRDARVLAHRGLMGPLPWLTRLYASLGGVRGDPETARAWLRAGTSLFCFPGGYHDSTRPIWRWRELDWNGRHGFARLAIDEHVPIVPVAIHGAHFTFVVLGSLPLPAWFARLLGTRHARLAVTLGEVGLVAAACAAALGVAAPWWMAVAAFNGVLPFPVPITFEGLPAIDPAGRSPQELAQEVRTAIEGALARGVEASRGAPLWRLVPEQRRS